MNDLTIKLTPTDERIDVITTQEHEVDVYPDTYQVEITNDWYKTVNLELVVDDPVEQVTVKLNYRDYLTGDLTSERVFQWTVDPELIMQGVIAIE